MADSLTLPAMSIPFASASHPDIDQLERDALAWAAVRVPLGTLRHLEKTRAGRIVARTASPNCPRELLDVYARFLVWGFWFDDKFVDDLPADSPAHAPAIASVLDILDSGRGTGTAGHTMEEAFREILLGLEAVLSPSQMARWRQEMRVWFASMTFQNATRMQTPTVATYQTLRRYTVCTYPCIVLIDASRGPQLGWDDWHHPGLATLRLHTANVVAWQNDVFSYFAEQRHPGAFWNLPSIYVAHGMTPADALRQAAYDTTREVEAFQQRTSDLWPGLSTAQRSHVDSLRSWMRGCYDWHRETSGRYIGWPLDGTDS